LKRILNEGSKVILKKALQDREILQRFYFDLAKTSSSRDKRERFLNSALAVSLQEYVVVGAFLTYLKIQLEEEQIKILSQQRRLVTIILDLLEFCGCNYALSDYEDVKRTLPLFLTKIEQISLALDGHIPRSEKSERTTGASLSQFIWLIRQDLGFRIQGLARHYGLKSTQIDIENSLSQQLNVAGNKAFFNTLLYEAHLESWNFLLDLLKESNKIGGQESGIDVDVCFNKAIAELENNRKTAQPRKTKS